VGIISFFASGQIAKEYAQAKFQEWRQKWVEILANLSEEQAEAFLQSLKARHPFVFHVFAGSFSPGLPPP